MKVRLTVWVGTTSVTPRLVTITAPDHCAPEDLRADAVARLVASTLGVPGDALASRDRLVPQSALLGHPPLLDGASVRLIERDQWSPPHRSPQSAATELAVVGGPDAGHTRPLTAGPHIVGRAGADLTIADPSLSRLHLRVDVTPAGITVTDLGSENGTRANGEILRSTSAMVGAGTVITAGQTTLALRAGRIPPAATAARGDGTITVSRAVVPVAEPPHTTISVPSPPERRVPRRVPWLTALIPVPIALLLASLFGPHLLLFALMSPMMILGNVVSDRWGARHTHAEETRRHQDAVQVCASRRESALATERGWREVAFPDLAHISRIALGPGATLWSRPAGPASPLVVRIGRGSVTSGVTWIEDETDRPVPLPAAPVLLDLTREGSVSVTGSRAGGVADSIIGQLVTLHSPTEVTVLTDRSHWATVPHVRHGDATRLVRETQSRLRADEEPSGLVVLAIAGSELDSQELDALSSLCRDGPARGILTVVIGHHVTAARGHLHTSPARAILAPAEGPPHEVVVDAVGPTWAARVASALTAVRDGATHTSELPHSVRLADALGLTVQDASAHIGRRWADADDGAWVTLGLGAAAPQRLDLATAGPHAIVGGTTGSGKSELLRTLVTSLSVEHPPEDLAIVLIDYKGGSAFAGMEGLPHIVGLVSDLDPALTQRALTSLTAEVRRRERLLAEAGVSDIAGYRRHCRVSGNALPPLARLIIVVDEFRALADELPDFVSGLVRLAAVGRSLGFHLVLATQRPAGVVTADMRANLNLRIALRMRDRSDSQDVIESDVAASLPRSIPGRAVLRAGAEPLETFQTATVAGAAESPHITAEVCWADGTSIRREFPATPVKAEVDLVTAVSEAAHRGQHTPPPSPWLPALPSTLAWSPAYPRTAWAQVDDPARQRQDPALIDLATMSHTAVAGSVGSGRTTTAFSLSLAALAGDDDVHLYAVADPTGPFATLQSLPHTGALIDRSDPAALAWFADRLAADVRRRQQEVRAAYLLMVIDGWDVVADACDRLDHGAVTDRLLATLREGYAFGIRAIVTGDRSVLTGRVGRTLPARHLHRPADDTDVVLAGLRPAAGPGDWPAGRLLRADDAIEHQVLLRALDDVPLGSPNEPPWRMSPLPTRVPLAELRPATADLIPVGVGGDGGEVAVGPPGRRRLLVLGSPGSGRTCALVTITRQAAAARRMVCVVADPDEELARLTEAGPRIHCIGWSEDERLVELRRTHPDLVVVADDVDRHLDSRLVPALEQISALAERDGGLIAVAGDAAGISMRQRGIGVAVARGRTAIVLGAPSPLDRDVVGVALPRPGEIRPGRGWLVADRTTIPLQVALAPHPSTPSVT